MKTNSLRVILLAATLFLAGPAKPDIGQALTWWVENASRKVMQDRPPQPLHVVTLEAARNEFEPFQVVLRADGGNLTNVDARMSDLIGPGGAIIPSENVTLYRAWYVTVTEASGHGGLGDGVPGNPRAPGEYVDPLIPFFDPYDPRHFAVGTPFSIQQNSLQPIFGDIYVPPDIPAGDYEGTLRVTVGFALAAEAPVKLHVWNFTLSDKRRVATAYGFSFGGVLDYHGGPDGAWDDEALTIMKTYEETLHKFRIDLTNVIQGPPYLPSPFFTFDGNGNLNPPDYTAFDEQMGARFNGTRFRDGIDAVMLNNELFGPGHGRSMTDDQFIKATANFAQHLKQKGWWERIYVYVHDEPWLFPGAFEAIAYDVALMKMGDPDWVSRMMATNHWVKELQYSIGIWCPLTGNYDKWDWSQPEYGRADYQKLIAKGQKLWFYVCNATFPPYAGYDIDTIWGHETRILMWGSWYEGASGFLLWSTNYWYYSDPWGTLLNTDAFPWIARTGDGFILYPGDHNGTAGAGVGSPSGIAIDGPIITLRLMMTREGLEDWEYLLMAEDLGGKDYAKTITETIYTQLGINPASYDQANPPWTYDDNKIYQTRSQLGEWIEATLNPPPEQIPAPSPISSMGQDGRAVSSCSMSSISDANSLASLAILLALAFVAMLLMRRFARRSAAAREVVK